MAQCFFKSIYTLMWAYWELKPWGWVCVSVCACVPVRGRTHVHMITNCLSSRLFMRCHSFTCALLTVTHTHTSGLWTALTEYVCVCIYNVMALLTWGPRTPQHSPPKPNGCLMDRSPPPCFIQFSSLSSIPHHHFLPSLKNPSTTDPPSFS